MARAHSRPNHSRLLRTPGHGHRHGGRLRHSIGHAPSAANLSPHHLRGGEVCSFEPPSPKITSFDRFSRKSVRQQPPGSTNSTPPVLYPARFGVTCTGNNERKNPITPANRPQPLRGPPGKRILRLQRPPGSSMSRPPLPLCLSCHHLLPSRRVRRTGRLTFARRNRHARRTARLSCRLLLAG